MRCSRRCVETAGEGTLVAEDLGTITPEVLALRDEFALPGMKVLQFAFDGDPDNWYLPGAHGTRSVVYTGTHDNDTTLGWWESLDDGTRERVRGTCSRIRRADAVGAGPAGVRLDGACWPSYRRRTCSASAARPG